MLENERNGEKRELTEAETELKNDIFGASLTEKCRKKVELRSEKKRAQSESGKGGKLSLNIALLTVLALAAVLISAFKLLEATPAVIVSSLLASRHCTGGETGKQYMMRSAVRSETEALSAYGCAA